MLGCGFVEAGEGGGRTSAILGAVRFKILILYLNAEY